MSLCAPQDPGKCKISPRTEVDLKVLQRPSTPKMLKNLKRRCTTPKTLKGSQTLARGGSVRNSHICEGVSPHTCQNPGDQSHLPQHQTSRNFPILSLSLSLSPSLSLPLSNSSPTHPQGRKLSGRRASGGPKVTACLRSAPAEQGGRTSSG